MSRSAKSSDDEPKAGTSKTRNTRARTATMDTITSDKTRLRTRKHPISYTEVNEIDVPLIPEKRRAKKNLGTATSFDTSTKVCTRAASKCLMHAGSETQSQSLPAARTTCRTKASSVKSDHSKSHDDVVPIKTCGQTFVLPSSSSVKEEIDLEDRIPYVRLDATIVEADEVMNSGNSDSSPDKALRLQQRKKISEKYRSINKDEVEEDNGKEESSTDMSKSDGTLPLEKKDEIQTEDIDRVTADTTNILIEKLREVPPNLYRTKYAVHSKLNEILLKAERCTNPEKECYLQSALTLCKERASKLELNAVCRKFVVYQFYTGVLELCICWAERIDPNNAASRYYKNNKPIEDQEGNLAFTKRLEIYKEFTRMLDHLYHQNNPLTPTIPSKPGPPLQTASNAVVMPAKEILHEIINDALHKPCITLQYSIYTWMIQDEELYEGNNLRAASANVLKASASKVGSEISLAERVEYLRWAIRYMESSKRTLYRRMFLSELINKLKVAEMQKEILETISNQQNLSDSMIVTDAKLRLNSSLLDISQLYEEYAEPFQLWKCKLALMHLSGHRDDTLIKEIWTNIIDNELKNATGPLNEVKMTILMCKIKLLREKYFKSPYCFPIDFLVEELLMKACKYKVTSTSIMTSFLELGVPTKDLLNICDEMMIGKNRRFWFDRYDLNHLQKLKQILQDNLRY